MKRDLEAMASRDYDLVIVGGGITGACIARDAALRGLSVALIEKRDFASATSGASSKLIHGGLRYLQNLELGLVRESLRERRIWSNVAPHMIDPLTFLMPTSGHRIRDRVVKAVGLTLYDWLAYDRNRLDDPEKEIPKHKKLSRKETVALEPGLESDGLTGAMIFYDYQMYSPERMTLECVLDAVDHGAAVANYAEVVEILAEDNRVVGVRVRDTAPRAPRDDTPAYEIRGRLVVNAAGPWADVLMADIERAVARGRGEERPERPPRHLIRSKGIHLLTRSLTQHHAIAVVGESTHFFILPWRGYSLIGTTDTVYRGDPDKVNVTEKDIVDFLATVNKGYPAAHLGRSDVLFFYAGLRPIVDTTSGDPKEGQTDETDSYNASRAAEVYDHETEESVKGMITAIGGKWTTSRHLAEQVVDLAMTKIEREPVPCVTATTPTYNGHIGPFAEFREKAVAEHPDLAADIVENLAKNYGGHMDDVLQLAKEQPHLAERLSSRFPDIAAEVVYGVRKEMALTLEDMLFRRTGLGSIGSPGDEALQRIARIMAEELGWNEAERAAQTESVIAKFTSWARTKAVVNPRSWGGRTAELWPNLETKLRQAIGPTQSVFTDAPMAAMRLTRQALREGMQQIIAVGGDGTVNEVVNGFFENGELINPEAMLAVLTSGTGADFRRTFGAPDSVEAQIERLAMSEIRSVDLGKLTFINHEGIEEIRYFDNIASFGLSGATDCEVNRLKFGKKFSGKTAFFWGMLKALVTYRNQPVRLQVDDVFDEVVDVRTAAVCNGQYFGGGMRMAPNAEPDDGWFDVIIVADIGVVGLLKRVNSIYRGDHLKYEQVTALRGRRVTATPVDPSQVVLLDVDGEDPGRLPATFEIIPNAINLRC
ncbi:MAG TPA: FAD-dependent oxidoreductase [Candidatus Hydrogenedentes bacterium]|nr:FAD-dependent oxidoreductase [Candidatus Hydrogenedentota bacterium]HPG68199.1 FAD-dependent oxidoreductase [Candidatus Hydrogenedentota bacterium]